MNSIFSCTARESLARPQFVEKLKNLTVKQGTLVELAVRAIGNPLPDIVWLKNSDIISPHKHPQIRYVLYLQCECEYKTYTIMSNLINH